MNFSKSVLYASVFGLAVALVVPAQADDKTRSQQDQSSQKSAQKQSRHSKDKQHSQRGDRSRQQSSTDRSHNRYHLNMEGWVHVGVDYDRDGMYDAVETIFLYDLEKAQNQSRQRSQARRGSARLQRGERGQRGQQVQFTGKIKNLQEKKMTSSDQKQMVAKLKTDEGKTLRVCLGTKEKVSQLDLEKGDEINVKGVRARINDEAAVMAQFVSFEGESIQNQLPQQQRLRKFQGTIQNTRKTSFQGRNGRFLVADLALNGKEKTRRVNLGPASEFEDVDLSEGTSIKLLAREGRINNQEALIAQLIRVDGQSIDVREPTRRTIRGEMKSRKSLEARETRQETADSNRDEQSIR
ncbi:hypothetical protein [Gimesia algae]|uniref:Magnetosome protein MamS/MamX domain-containing protein n=1 Tax=Gimesia algae TaxID=2527971 RepID=A0A517VJX8_9PLAN|nr:hypothetical protein [Gimesia algae]QDT93331.1 hypothetical protein Pan161_50100 [Gimesia algae]